MTEENPFDTLKKSRYDSKPTVHAPTPPPLNESMWDLLARKGTQLGLPLWNQADAFVRHGVNTGLVGLGDTLERNFGNPTIADTDKHTAEAREKLPEATLAGQVAGTAAQALPISRVYGTVRALGAPVFGSQVANQALTGATQSAIQQFYEANRDEKDINPAKLATGVFTGGVLGAVGGAGANILGARSAPGVVARTIPQGLNTAERTALVKSLQRGQNAGFNPDLAEGMRASKNPELAQRMAPTVERQIRRGGEKLPGEELPVHMQANQAHRQEPGGYFDRKAQADAALSEVTDDIAAARAANVRAERGNRAANEPGLPQEPQPRAGGKFTGYPQGPVRPLAYKPVPDNTPQVNEVNSFKALRDLEDAAVNRPSLPEAPGTVRPQSFTARIPGLGDYRWSSGMPKTGPTPGNVGAADMMQKQPEVAAGLLGRVPMNETVIGSLPSSLGRDASSWLLMQALGLNSGTGR